MPNGSHMDARKIYDLTVVHLSMSIFNLGPRAVNMLQAPRFLNLALCLIPVLIHMPYSNILALKRNKWLVSRERASKTCFSASGLQTFNFLGERTHLVEKLSKMTKYGKMYLEFGKKL